ncbi:hypothetical protein SLA2020_471010 [Shorea laevis]
MWSTTLNLALLAVVWLGEKCSPTDWPPQEFNLKSCHLLLSFSLKDEAFSLKRWQDKKGNSLTSRFSYAPTVGGVCNTGTPSAALNLLDYYYFGELNYGFLLHFCYPFVDGAEDKTPRHLFQQQLQ